MKRKADVEDKAATITRKSGHDKAAAADGIQTGAPTVRKLSANALSQLASNVAQTLTPNNDSRRVDIWALRQQQLLLHDIATHQSVRAFDPSLESTKIGETNSTSTMPLHPTDTTNDADDVEDYESCDQADPESSHQQHARQQQVRCPAVLCLGLLNVAFLTAML